MAGRPKRNADIALLDRPHVGAQALQMLTDGALMGTICKKLGVSKLALIEWLGDSRRSAEVTRARVSGAAALVEESLEIADGNRPIIVDGQALIDSARDKLRIQTRQWIAERVDRSSWGAQPLSLTVNVNGLHLEALRQRAPLADVIDADTPPGGGG